MQQTFISFNPQFHLARAKDVQSYGILMIKFHFLFKVFTYLLLKLSLITSYFKFYLLSYQFLIIIKAQVTENLRFIDLKSHLKTLNTSL